MHPQATTVTLRAFRNRIFDQAPGMHPRATTTVAPHILQQDVRDRARLYYNLMKADMGEAERIIRPPLLEVWG